MSHHAELSPEVAELLAQQKRNSTISAILIALLVIGLIAMCLALWALKAVFSPPDTVAMYTAVVEEEEVITDKKVTETIKRKPASQSAARSSVIVAPTVSATAISTDKIVFELDPTLGEEGEFGETGFGDSGLGEGAGQIGVIPTILRQRCSAQDRRDRMAKNGGSTECEEAVIKALDYFKKTQNKDGSWTKGVYSVGYTSLVLLSYLGHCETPASAEYGETVQNAIAYIVNRGLKNKEGLLVYNKKSRHYPYEHSIATYALAEALSLSRAFGHNNIPNLEESVQKAGQLIIDKQNKTGGWEYNYQVRGGADVKWKDKDGNERTNTREGGDTSLAGWHVQALKAIDHTGLEFDGLDTCVNRALRFFKKYQHEESGGISYSTPEPKGINNLNGDGSTLGAVGALCFQIFDKGNQKACRKAVAHVAKHMETNYTHIEHDLYGLYYAAQVMLNEGGSKWSDFNNSYRDILLANQAENGSWKPPFNGKELTDAIKKKVKHNAVGATWTAKNNTGEIYRTALATLTLEVYYRFLPSFEK